jgi:hypothetical protein
MILNRKSMTIHAPDPALEQRAMTELVEAVAAAGDAGRIAGQLIVRAHQALAEDESVLAHRLGDLGREILNAARRRDRQRTASVPVFRIAPAPRGEIAMDDLERMMGREG